VHFTDYDTRLAAYALIVDDREQILLTWFNGSRSDPAGWSLPGGGVEYEESLEEAVVREVHEEAGYDVVVGPPVATHSFTGELGRTTGRPYKSTRVIFEATIVGGELGTLEVGGSTDYAAWVPIDDVATQPSRADIVDIAVSVWHRRSEGTTRHR
jgi:8-oxo-dGTP diphosphatase